MLVIVGIRMSNINVGLIGIGKWGSILKKKLKKNSNLVFAVGRKKKYLNKLDKIDWVFIATPDNSHYKIVKKLLILKKNVFCEKPLTLNYKKSKQLFDVAKKNKVKLYVDDIQTYYNKKIKLQKNNYITRKKKGHGIPKNLLYRFAYHDFYYLYNYIKKKKIKLIKIKDKKFDLKFELRFNDNQLFIFDYSLRSEIKIHRINRSSFITKQDVLAKMIRKILYGNVDFGANMRRSLYANKLIDKINKKI